MVKTLKKLLLSRRSILWAPALTMAVTVLATYLFLGVLNGIDTIQVLPLAAGLVQPIVLAFLMFILSFSGVLETFSQAVAFSQARRRALGLTLSSNGCSALSALVTGGVLVALEHMVAPALGLWLSGADRVVWGESPTTAVPELWQGTQAEWQEMLEEIRTTLYLQDVALDWWWWLAAAALGMALGLITGAIIQRFGARGMWAVWCVFILLSLAPQLLGYETMLFSEFVIYLEVIAGFLGVVGLVWSVRSLLRATIR